MLALVCLFVTSFALAEAPVAPAASAPVAVEAPKAPEAQVAPVLPVDPAAAPVVETPVVEAPVAPVALEAAPATDAEAVAQAQSAFDAFQAGQILVGVSLLLGALYYFYKKYGPKKS